MKACAVRSLIHLSTISVHGLDPIQGSPVNEASGFGKRFLPHDHYGRAKAQAERIVQTAHRSGHLQATVLRVGWVYGPGDETSYGRLADRLKQGLLPRIGGGDNRIPLVYAGNAARAIWCGLLSQSREYAVYIYAFDGQVTQNDYLRSLARAAQTTRKPRSLPRGALLALVALNEHLAAWSGYRLPTLVTRYFIHLFGSDWRFDQRHLAEGLRYSPEVSYDEGFAIAEAWYQQARSIP
jgi:nucleoside-diphosphate-sugar epimerase